MEGGPTRKKLIRPIEILLISVVWIVLVVAPVLFRDGTDELTWKDFSRPIETLIPLLVVFAINRFILVPGFLFRNKRIQYLLSAFVLIAIVTVSSFLFTDLVGPAQPRPEQSQQFRQSPPPPLNSQPPPRSPNSPPSQHMRPPSSFPHPSSPQPRPMPPFVNVMIFSFLLVGFDTGLRMAVKLTESEREKDQLEKDHMETQLTMLKNQVSPHFFMNTLNNIHSLIDINTSEAKEAVIRLSNLMRYLLYETESGKTTLKDELEFVKSYIDLMKLRFTDNVRITLRLPERIPDKQISPFLFTSLIENAFKHGISYKTKSYIVVDIAVDENRLLLVVKNSISSEKQQDPPSGIGIENTRKRLDLLFGDNYHLDILDDGTEFNVNLSIPI